MLPFLAGCFFVEHIQACRLVVDMFFKLFCLQEYATGEAKYVFEGIEEENQEGILEKHIIHQSEITEECCVEEKQITLYNHESYQSV